MKLKKILRSFFLMGISLISSSLQGGCFDDPCPCDPSGCNPLGVSLVITNAYRQDSFKCHANTFDSNDALVDFDHLKANNISYYQLGLFADWFKCGWLLYTSGDYAWGGDGTYREHFGIPAVSNNVTRARVHEARAWDFTIGGGYLFELGDCGCGMGLDGISLGPVAGWSYHSQRFQINRAETNDVEDTALNGLQYTNKWQGPFVGVELLYEFRNWVFNAGYEYHWANWNATWQLDGPDNDAVFSDRRKSSDAYGNVGYVSGSWLFCEGWNLGLGIKYQAWSAPHGHLRPRAGFPAVDLDGYTIRTKIADWNSWDISVNLGYTF